MPSFYNSETHRPVVIARSLTAPQRDLLLRHIDGKATVELEPRCPRNSALTALVRRRLVYFVGPGAGTQRPRQSSLTDLGRATLCAMLAEYAEALVLAGALEGIPAKMPTLSPPVPAQIALPTPSETIV